jgi:hypothetical protein
MASGSSYANRWHWLVYLISFALIVCLCRGGFNGFCGGAGYEPIILTVDKVADIHHVVRKRVCLWMCSD